MRSLRFKILAVAAALVLLSQAGTVMTVLVTANRDVSERARGAVEAGARVFEQTNEARAAQLGNTVNALASDYAFKQAVASRELETLRSALANHTRRAGADLGYLLDEDGNVVTTTGRAGATEPARAALVEMARERGIVHSTMVRGGVAYEVLTAPVNAPLPIAWVSMAFALGDDYVRRLEDVTGLHVTILDRSGARPVAVASGVDGPERGALAVAAAGLGDGGARTLDVAGAEHLVVARPFVAGAGDVAVLLSESIDEAMAPYAILRTAAFVLGGLPLLLALAGAVLLSRALTRPVQQLAEAARRMKDGDYSRPVAISTGDELEQLAVTFNAMQDDIARREARITFQARHDTLTGLPNRDWALQQLEEAIAAACDRPQNVTAMVLDLDAVGEITASLGHDIADAYVRQAAEQLRAHLEPHYQLARLEGDCFLLVLPDVGAGGAADVAERLVARLEPGIGLRDLNVHVRPAVGVAVYPEHGASSDELLLRATVARTDGRQSERRIRIYHGGDEDRRVRRLAILGDLRRAVRHEELRLFYQPKLSLADGSVCGAEALVRWEHPQLGRLSPTEFIPIAEQSGNISILSRWAITAAARECRLWQEEGLDLPVSVNLSAHDLLDKDLPWFVLETLRNHDLEPRLLVAEITEEGIVRDFDNARHVLQRLRDSGIRISIDDFGAGYSSLAQIRKLPVDELKIDRSFVTRLPDDRADAAIVGAAIDLAHNLGLGFVAEGVETRPALRWLRDRGCDRVQGFYVSRPLPPEEFVAWARGYAGELSVRVPALKAV